MSQVAIVVGADPELFFVNNAGEFISSIDKIGGSKDFPLPIDEEGCAVQEDNVAVEYNIPPCKSAEEFLHYNKKVLAHIAAKAAEMGLSTRIVPSANFSAEELEHPRAQEFGCEPDFNAWNGGQMNPRPNAEDKSLRSAGGHLHIGNIDGLDILEVVKACDLFIGCQMVAFDKDTKRRSLYGNPGAFRPKPYGVEYRTASNAWLKDDATIRWAFGQVEKAVDFVRNGGKIGDDVGALIQECIKESSEAKLHQINQLFGIAP